MCVNNSVDTGRKLNADKTFNLRPASAGNSGENIWIKILIICKEQLLCLINTKFQQDLAFQHSFIINLCCQDYKMTNSYKCFYNGVIKIYVEAGFESYRFRLQFLENWRFETHFRNFLLPTRSNFFFRYLIFYHVLMVTKISYKRISYQSQTAKLK